MAIIAMSVGWWWAFVAVGVGLWWAFTTPARARQSSGTGDMAQRRCIVEAVGSGSYTGHRRCGCGVVVSLHCHWCWVVVFTTCARARRSGGAGDMAQQRRIVEVVGSGSY
jgi:hypothetical protein